MLKKILSGLMFFCLGLQAEPTKPFNEQAAGIYSWANWKPHKANRELTPDLRGVAVILGWKKLEPRDGEYKFDEQFGELLKKAHANDYYVHIMIWVAPGTPEWVYEIGVPKVFTDRKVNALGHATNQNYFPYYFDALYQKRYFKLLSAWGEYIDQLPDHLHKRILFVQSCEGSTGDGWGYKGKPLDKKYAVSREQWDDFRIMVWGKMKQIFQEKSRRPLLIAVNSDANTSKSDQWLKNNLGDFGLKMGMSSHGYHVSDNQQRYDLWQEKRAVNPNLFSRGEMDGELYTMNWSKHDIPTVLYWSGLFSLHMNLDIWNIPQNVLQDSKNSPAFQFFNEYAPMRNPQKSTKGFCALRKGLDAANIQEFPQQSYGSGKGAMRVDLKRYKDIVKKYAAYGAQMEDPKAASLGGMANRNRKGINDAGWKIMPGNYERFVYQLDADETSQPWWSVDESIYGRFARSFGDKGGKMFFKINEQFAKSAKKMKLTITYLDKGQAQWTVNQAGKDLQTIRCRNSGEWKKAEFTYIPKANENQDEHDFIIKKISGVDVTFHLIEVEKI
ncbi:hypothetical protein PQO01_14555 [Lentisphaera marina]|uniref:hypothetical protein n=1 Tax=Lentisphaera marina TaxID=1111041 RepID=UPI0023650BD4|nr:hypothetical protein [Lentisphaera marina]MDD7986170.1 hypothetical protein [Lentisphaera marina]